jgi:hypothetical protein
MIFSEDIPCYAAKERREANSESAIVKIILIIAGALCDLGALFLTILTVDMFQHPRGIGAEKITGPFLGLVAVSLFAASALCFVISSRIKFRPEGQ